MCPNMACVCVVTIDDFDILKPIGKGGFGKVFAAVNHLSNELVAIKRIEKAKVCVLCSFEPVCEPMCACRHQLPNFAFAVCGWSATF